MPLDLQYSRGLRSLSNVSPEIRAIPQTDALAASFGRAGAQQRLSDASTGLGIRSMREQVRQNRLDQDAANKDSLLALGVTAATGGLQLAVNKGKGMAQQEAERRAQEESDMWGAIGEVLMRNWQEIEKRLTVTAGGGA